jgi:hypothetical protein
MDVVIPAGYYLTEDYVENIGSVDEYPNIARWLIYFTPERIVDYMTANCSTSKVGGNTVSGWLERDDFGPFLGKHSSFWEFAIIFVLGIMCRMFKEDGAFYQVFRPCTITRPHFLSTQEVWSTII